MFPIIRVRLDARRLARQIRESLTADAEKWKISKNDDRQATLSNGHFEIVLVPRAVRVFDAIHVYSDGAEIWFPFVARLRLRAAARLRLIENASEKAGPGANRTRSRRQAARRRRAKRGT